MKSVKIENEIIKKATFNFRKKYENNQIFFSENDFISESRLKIESVQVEREKEGLFALAESRVLFLIASRCRRCRGTLSLPQKTLSSPIKAITLSPCRDNGRMESSTHLCIPQCISIYSRVLFLPHVLHPSKVLFNRAFKHSSNVFNSP